MPVQDLMRYRDSGELSDLTVRLGDKTEWKLHRFPLFIKSDRFRNLLSDQSAASSVVELELDFPGGAECFALVADFCYNKRIDIAPENAVQLRCAAERLAMRGRGNLADLADRYLEELLAAARAARSAGSVVDLLTQCEAVGQAADEIRLSERCLAVLLDIWHRTEASAAAAAALGYDSDDYLYRHHNHHHHNLFSPIYSNRQQQQQQQRDTESHLLNLPLARFLQLIRAVCPPADGTKSSQGESVVESDEDLDAGPNARLRRRPLAVLAARYLDQAFCRHLAPPPATAPTPPEREMPKSSEPAVKAADESADPRNSDETPKELDKEDNREGKDEPPSESATEVLDRVVLTLPDDTPLSEVINADWIRRALRISETTSPECRAKLLQLAGGALHRFTQDELRETPAPILCEIVENTVKNDCVVPEVLSCVVDSHLLDLARAGGLSVEDFVKLAGSMPPDYRTSHDTLYEAAEALLTAEPTPTESDQQRVFGALDLNRCNEATLQRALDRGLVPAGLVCQAAIDIAKKLREKLEERERLRHQDDHRSFRREFRGPLAASSSSTCFAVGSRRFPGESAASGRHLVAEAAAPAAVTHYSSHYQQPQQQYQFDEFLSSLGSERATNTTSYSSAYSSSKFGGRRDDDESLVHFEESLRAQLSKISASYDNYLAEKGGGIARSEQRASYRGSSSAGGRRW